MLNVHSKTKLILIVNKIEFCKHLHYKGTQLFIARGTY